jgi:hypothetical protein
MSQGLVNEPMVLVLLHTSETLDERHVGRKITLTVSDAAPLLTFLCGVTGLLPLMLLRSHAPRRVVGLLVALLLSPIVSVRPY